MSKNFATFSDVKPFARVAEMPSGVVVDNTRFLFKQDRSHLFPAADFSWLNGYFKPYCQLRSHAFYVLTPSP
jgi:hypothetical protein